MAVKEDVKQLEDCSVSKYVFFLYIYIYCAFGNYCILFKSDLFLLIFLSVYSEFLLTVEMGDLLLAKIGNDSKNWYRMDLDFQEK